MKIDLIDIYKNYIFHEYMKSIPKGAYVVATKFEDGDPNDQWCVGWFDRYEDGRYYVVDDYGQQYRMNGFRRVMKINDKAGAYIIKEMQKVTYHSDIYVWQIVADAMEIQQ